jgi:hypothetical protein
LCVIVENGPLVALFPSPATTALQDLPQHANTESGESDLDPGLKGVWAVAAPYHFELPATWPWETTVVAQTTTTTVSGPIIELRGSGAVVLIAVVGLAIALIWFVPLWMDARRAYRLRERAVQLIGGRLLDAAKKDDLSISELRALLGTIGEPATGQRGLSRALMAFTIITVVGVALLALLLSSSSDASDLRKTVITALLTLLGTIVGFYFGTRAAETSAEQANPVSSPPAQVVTPPAPAPTPPAPSPVGDGAQVAEEDAARVANGEEPAPAADEEMAEVTDEEADAVADGEESSPVTDDQELAPATEDEALPLAQGEELAPAAEGDESGPIAEEQPSGAAVSPRRRKAP